MKTPAATTEKKEKTRTNEPWVELAEDAEGWHWQLYAGNGRPVCRNSLPYDTKKHALQAIRLLPGVWAKANVIAKVTPPE